ncbi:MAG: hypothetical protein V3T41_07445 [bacterium]
MLVCAATPTAARGDGGVRFAPRADVVAQANPGEEKTEDLWKGVRISRAYKKLKCPQCGKSNDLRAAECRRCGYRFPQPSPDVTDPSQVFVPGKGYYREGALLEPAQSRAILWVPGVALGVVGLSTMSAALSVLAGEETGSSEVDTEAARTVLWIGSGMTVVGVVLTVIGFTSKTKAVYAFAQPAGRAPVARVAVDSAPRRAEGLTFKFGLSFSFL